MSGSQLTSIDTNLSIMGEPFNAPISIERGIRESDSLLAPSTAALNVGVGEQDVDKAANVNEDGYSLID